VQLSRPLCQRPRLGNHNKPKIKIRQAARTTENVERNIKPPGDGQAVWQFVARMKRPPLGVVMAVMPIVPIMGNGQDGRQL